MATTYHTLNYTIWLTNAEQVKELQAARARIDNGSGVLVELNPSRISDPGALYAAPATAAALYGAQILTPQQPNVPPSITSEWITSNTNNVNYPLDEYKFERKSGGWFGISWLFGDTHAYRWRGTFAYKNMGAVVEGEETTPDEIPTRYWIDGFEVCPTDVRGSRDASRHTSGLGHKAVSSSSAKISHLVTEHDAGLTTVTQAWERFYLRRRGLPDAATAFWVGTFSLNMEMVLKILPTGQVMAGDGEGSAFTPMATIADPLPDGEWVKIDLLYKVNTGDAPYLEVYFNGELKLRVTGFQTNFANAGCYFSGSSIGIGLNDSSNTVALDFDDWICAAQPTAGLSVDWLNGTKIVKLPFLLVGDDDTGGYTYSSGHVQNATQGQATRDDSITSNVASAVIELVGDPDVYLLDRGLIGPVSIRAGVTGTRGGSGGNDFQLGYSVAGGPIQYNAAHTFGISASTRTLMYQPAMVSDPSANVFDPISVAHKNESGTPGTSTLTMLWVEVELCGIWGKEDVSAASVISPEELAVLGNTGKHVSPYPESVWARRGMPPVSPVLIKSGTYSGNGTSQILTFNAPVTWLFVRQLTGGTSRGAHWWTSMNAGSTGDSEGVFEHGVARLRQVGASAMAEDDQEYTYELTIAGSDSYDNDASSTFWYCAFMDPGMRFSLNTALQTQRPTVAGIETALEIQTWQAEAAFTRKEGNSNQATGSSGFKGISDVAGGGITRVGSAYNADGLYLGEGNISTGANWNNLWGDGQVPVALWRRDDGSGDPGVDHVIQLITWVGDAAASRTISFSRPTGSKRPLFVIIWPNSTGTVGYRDPQNTGTTSYTSNGSSWSNNASTGITAGGIDQFTVGSTFNSNGVVYNAFVIVGGETAGNNGWSGDGEFIPVEPTEPIDWPGLIPQTEIPDPLPIDWIDGGGTTDPENPVEPGGSDFGDQCVDASTKVCRQALSHIGVTQTISDITADLTPEAEMCRLHYADAVAEALRRFPWAFATKYADCPRVAGTEAAPVNGDWIYSYRMPTDCIFARRIVRPEKGREFDDDPPKFRQTGSDATGRLILSNYADPEGEAEPLNTLPLEYTYRPGCAATQGDALFRSALAWLMASKLAPALARNKVTARDAFQMYLAIGHEATVVNAREQQQYTQDGDAPWLEDR